MAEPEVEAAWRAELERIGEKQPGDILDSGNTSKKQVPLHWLGDEVEARETPARTRSPLSDASFEAFYHS